MITDKDNYVIYKYPITIIPGFSIEVPGGSSLLHIGEQGSDIFAWVLQPIKVDGTRKLELEIHGTGHGFRTMRDKRFVTTVIDKDMFVWHFFEVLPNDQTKGVRTPNDREAAYFF